MVKDKYAKALEFMVNMKFTDSCIGFAAEAKQCGCLAQFLGEEINSSDAIFLATFHMIFGMVLQKMMMKT